MSIPNINVVINVIMSPLPGALDAHRKELIPSKREAGERVISYWRRESGVLLIRRGI